MAEANVVFSLNGEELTIQCKIEDKMKDICEKYSLKVGKEMNSLLFLYGGNQVNFELKFKEQANYIGINDNKMKILVYTNENGIFNCTKCGQKIKLNTEKFDELILSYNEIIDSLNGIKFQIDGIINIASADSMKSQLKNINKMLNIVNEDIKNNNEKIKNLLIDYNTYIPLITIIK